MPWEIDYALLMFEKLKRSSYFLSKDDTVYISAALNLTDYAIDWNESKLPKEYFDFPKVEEKVPVWLSSIYEQKYKLIILTIFLIFIFVS